MDAHRQDKKQDNPKHDKPQHETPKHVILFRYNPKTAVTRASRRALGFPAAGQQVGELGAPAQFPEEPTEIEERELIGAEQADVSPSASAAAKAARAKAKAEADANTPDDFLKSMTRYDALVIGRRDFDDHDKPVLNLAYFRHDDTASHHALNGVDWADTMERMLDVPHQSDLEQQSYFYLLEGEKLAPAKRPVDDDDRKGSGPELVPGSGEPADLSDMSKAERKGELGSMSKAELLDVAAQHGVQADDSMNKADIISAINKQLNKEAKTGTE